MKTNQTTFKLPYPLLLAAMMASGVANAAPSSATPAVIGHLPVASAVTIAPAAPKAGETVTATWAYTDVDGDTESGTLVEWLLDGQEPPAATGTSFALPSDAASKNLQVRITPRSQAPADPAQGVEVTSAGVVVAAAGSINATQPTTNRYTWPQADAYCKGLTPAARLPTRKELQDIFVNNTSATAIGQTNYEMCDIHGWPLNGGRCGGSLNSYWTSEAGSSGYHWYVSMYNGLAYNSSDTNGNQVTCVR
ncbi:TPA: DUF1566 domain-containing protein [Aeromonas veronii]|nr:DUF1566 domain-containing protein [Aeromonas veronii]